MGKIILINNYDAHTHVLPMHTYWSNFDNPHPSKSLIFILSKYCTIWYVITADMVMNLPA